jgi:hypothetical protein
MRSFQTSILTQGKDPCLYLALVFLLVTYSFAGSGTLTASGTQWGSHYAVSRHQ